MRIRWILCGAIGYTVILLFFTYAFIRTNSLSLAASFRYSKRTIQERILLSPHWKDADKAVIDCVTGELVRVVPGGRTLSPIELGFSLPLTEVEESEEERKAAFQEIYRGKLWGGQESPANGSLAVIGSGPGSTLSEAKNIMITLNVLINEIKVILGKEKIAMLDVPCGDFTWMSVFLQNRTDIVYEGMDIVPELIAHHNSVYASRNPRMTFTAHDAVTSKLNRKYDLILTREMTQHLTSSETARALENFRDSGSAFLLATTVPVAGPGELDLTSPGRHRLQNLEAPPLNLPPPLCASPDRKEEYMALWLLSSA